MYQVNEIMQRIAIIDELIAARNHFLSVTAWKEQSHCPYVKPTPGDYFFI